MKRNGRLSWGKKAVKGYARLPKPVLWLNLIYFEAGSNQVGVSSRLGLSSANPMLGMNQRPNAFNLPGLPLLRRSVSHP
jgi:hypothetical protein